MFVYQLFAVPVYLSPLARSCHHGGNAVPSVWQGRAIVVAQYCHTDGTGYRLYRFREQSVFLRVLYYNVPEVRCRKKVQKKSL